MAQTTSRHQGLRTQELHGAGAGHEVAAIVIYQVQDGKPTGKQWNAGRWIEAAARMEGDPIAHNDVIEIHAGEVARIVRKAEGPSYTAALNACQPFAVVTKGRTVLYVPAELIRETSQRTQDEHKESTTVTTYADLRLAHVRHCLELIPESERVGPYWQEIKYVPQHFDAIRIATGSTTALTSKGLRFEMIAKEINSKLHERAALGGDQLREVVKWATKHGAKI